MFLRTLWPAALGGAWAGTLVGLVESVLVTWTAAPGGEYWLFPFAVVSYGLLGVLVGSAYGIAAGLAAGRRPQPPRNVCGAAAALTLVLVGAIVARYHVIQRVFHEELVTFSALGIAVNLGVIAAVAVCALLVFSVGRSLQQHPRGLLAAAVALALCCGLSFAGAALASPRPETGPVERRSGPAAAGHPNVILIIADTLRADMVNGSDTQRAAMPALRDFAADGVRFEHAYAQSSWTRPSIATILTSLYPSQHGAMHKMDPLSDSVTTIAEAFGQHGYWTSGFVTNINVAPVFNFQQGFDEYNYLPPNFYFGASDSATRLAIYKILRVVRERLLRDRIYFYNYYQDAEVVDAAVSNWLGQQPPTPFFLLIHYMDPHDPYFEIPYDGRGVARVNDPDPLASRAGDLHGLYQENVEYLDRFLAELFSRLKEMGLYDSSIIVMTADHGEEFQEHQGWWHGTTLYEEQVHVPLLIKRAGETRRGEREVLAARSLDIAPTMLAAARLPVPEAFDGRDLFVPQTEPPVLFAEEDLEGNVLASLRSGPWKIITANPDNPRGLQPVELYNLEADPGERHNRAADEPARVQEMLQLLARQRAAIARRAVSQVERTRHAADHRS